MNERIYICHTFYHAYVTCLKEYHLRYETMRREGMPETADPLSPEVTAACGAATLVLSKMSNRFGKVNIPLPVRERSQKMRKSGSYRIRAYI